MRVRSGQVQQRDQEVSDLAVLGPQVNKYEYGDSISIVNSNCIGHREDTHGNREFHRECILILVVSRITWWHHLMPDSRAVEVVLCRVSHGDGDDGSPVVVTPV